MPKPCPKPEKCGGHSLFTTSTMPPPSYSSQDAFYFDSIEGFGDWPILLSARAQKDVRQANGKMSKMIIEKLKQLSLGQFSRNNKRSLIAPGMGVPIYRARMAGDKRIIYRVDCVSDPRYSYDRGSPYESQAIWIFGIFTLAGLHRTQFWDTLSRKLKQRGQDYVERCTIRMESQSINDVVLPSQFPPLPELDEGTPSFVGEEDIKEEDLKELHSLFVLDKFVMMSQAVLTSILTNEEIIHVPPLSTREREVVEHPSSCYVIGRSGTGKTTTMLLKMLGIHRAWKANPHLGPKPRQVFVTQSPVLRKRVEEYFVKLISSLDTDEAQDNKRLTQEDGLIGQEYSKTLRSDLPERFTGLLDEHFPLFITYDQLCTMLECDIGIGCRNNISSTVHKRQWTTQSTSLAGAQIVSSSDYMQQSRTNFVSYGVFLAWYWDRLPQKITQRLDPALVFGEFMGIIKGSEHAVGMETRCLDRESYKSLNVRSRTTFSDKRDELYDLFEVYDRLKGRQGDYDAADRTHRILEALDDTGLVGQKVDFLYVDEVQDHLLIDTLVLRMICANPHGLFWAGDTAQTISIGSTFRFSDLKLYQYRIERRLSCELGFTPAEPKHFELVTNHRSHSGIVNCARCIVKLMLRYWPNSIDALIPEQATTPGPRPIFFTGQENMDLEKLFFTNSRGKAIDLGAKQSILVRNDATKARLKERFPKLGENNFMTLHESKGLEFNDVILYNFFNDSPVTSDQWYLVLNGISCEDCPQDTQTFDGMRHVSVCVELKFLYVAVTRARQNLYIVDTSDTAGPMKMHWSNEDRVSIWSSSTEMPDLAAESTPEEWAETGKMFFHNGNYEQASVAFRRAGLDREEKICEAYSSKKKAELISAASSHSVARVRAFVTAANAFFACAQNSLPKHVVERQTCYRAAGDCYSDARDLKSAGRSYQLAELYTEAASTYQKGGFLDELVKLMTQHKTAFDDSHEQLFIAARIHCFKRLNVKAALGLFPSEDKALEFLETLDLDEARIKLLLALGRNLEAAAVHAKNGDMLRAVETLGTSAARGADLARRTIEYLLTGLRREFTLEVTPPSAGSTTSGLLVLTNKLDKSAMTEQEFDEFAMFRAIQRADHEALRALAKNFIGAKNDPAALLCLDHIFSSPLKLKNVPFSKIEASLSLYHNYVRLLNKFRRDESFVNGSNHQRLFGFRVQGGNRWLVPGHTLLHGKLTGKSDTTEQSADEHKCGLDQLRRGIAVILESRIHDRTRAQNKACYGIHGFSPCLRLLLQEKCKPPSEICTFQHIRPEQLSVDWYHTRLHLVFLQFQILESARLYDFNTAQCVTAAPTLREMSADANKMKSYWLRILYSTLHPSIQKLGSLAKIAIAKVPETDPGLVAVRNWVERACNELSDNSPQQVVRFRQLFMVICTLAFDLGRNDARKSLPRTPMYRSKQWPPSPFRGPGNSIVHDFVAFFTAKGRDSLTLGLSYLRGVLFSQLPVDLNVLCDLVERLTGLYIMAGKADPETRVLHEVALPRSWFINLLPLGTDPRKDISHIFKFASTVIEFMLQIDAQVQRYPTATSTTKERFIANDTRVTDSTGPLYIARICLCLCIMGYNIEDNNVRKRVLTSIQSLRKGKWQPTPLAYQRYANARDWDDLVDAFTDSFGHPSPDEMILLLHRYTFRSRRWWSDHACPVSYSTLGGVQKLLLSKPPSNRARTTRTRQQRQRHVERTTEAQPDPTHQEQRQPVHIDVPRELVTDSKEVEVEMDRPNMLHEREFDESHTKAAKVIQEAYRAYRHHSEQKRADAARRIQSAYRHHLRRRRVAREEIDEIQANHWHLLREGSKKMEMEWSRDPQYYLLFRVPLADILICLDTMGAFFESEKKKSNKRMMDPQHQDHEELMKAISQYKDLLKRTIKLQKKLSPSSEFHKRRSVTELQQAVLEVKEIVENLDTLPRSIETKIKIKQRWDRGRKWILEKQRSKLKGKMAEKMSRE